MSSLQNFLSMSSFVLGTKPSEQVFSLVSSSSNCFKPVF